MKKHINKKLSANERERQKQEEFRRHIAEEERMRHPTIRKPKMKFLTIELSPFKKQKK